MGILIFVFWIRFDPMRCSCPRGMFGVERLRFFMRDNSLYPFTRGDVSLQIKVPLGCPSRVSLSQPEMGTGGVP